MGKLPYIILGILKQVQNSPILVQQRMHQLEQKRKVYIWNFYFDIGLPSSAPLESKQHKDEIFDRSKVFDVIGVVFNGIVHGLKSDAFNILKLTKLMKDHSSMKSLQDAERIATSIVGEHAQSSGSYNQNTEELKINASEIHRWTNDSDFGRQILNGINCVVVKICTKLPENFPVTGEMVNPLLCRGLTIEQEMQVSLYYFVIMGNLQNS